MNEEQEKCLKNRINAQVSRFNEETKILLLKELNEEKDKKTNVFLNEILYENLKDYPKM